MDVVSTQTGNLSGGQKRKVSLAIALIGGSDVSNFVTHNNIYKDLFVMRNNNIRNKILNK